MMQSWYFNLDSFDSISGDVAYLSVSAARKLGSAKFQGNDPLDLRFDSRVLRIGRNIWDVQAPKREAACLITGVDSLHFLEGDIAASLLSLKRSVVTWAHLSVWIVSRIGELVAGAYWVKEFDCLVSTCRHNKLSL